MCVGGVGGTGRTRNYFPEDKNNLVKNNEQSTAFERTFTCPWTPPFSMENVGCGWAPSVLKNAHHHLPCHFPPEPGASSACQSFFQQSPPYRCFFFLTLAEENVILCFSSHFRELTSPYATKVPEVHWGRGGSLHFS